MAITNNGMHIVTAAHDRSIRLWERTEEPLILDEEKEQVNSGIVPVGLGLFGFSPIRNVKHNLKMKWKMMNLFYREKQTKKLV